jgi:hypothetical protein
VVPDCCSSSLRARLDDPDGCLHRHQRQPRGLNSVLKRLSTSRRAAVVVSGRHSWHDRGASHQAKFAGTRVPYAGTHMGLDGKAFTVYKFRSMPVDAET